MKIRALEFCFLIPAIVLRKQFIESCLVSECTSTAIYQFILATNIITFIKIQV